MPTRPRPSRSVLRADCALADELGGMAESSEQSGVASDIAREASERVRTVADWVEAREPADLLTELKGYARHKPGPSWPSPPLSVGEPGGKGEAKPRPAVRDSSEGVSEPVDLAQSGHCPEIHPLERPKPVCEIRVA